MDGRSYREQTQYDLLGNTCRKYGFGLFVQYGYSGRAGCGLSGVGGSGNTTSTQSAHQTASLYVPGVLTLYNGHDVRGNMVDAGGARFYEYSVLNQATSIWRGTVSNPTIRARFAYGSDGQRYRRIDDGSTAGGTTTTTYIGSVERRQLPGGSIQWRRSVAGVVLIEHYGDSVSGGITQASGTGTVRHQFSDHLGSVQVIGSVSGSSITVLERLDTDAHGEWRIPSPPFGQAGSSHTSRGFTGHEHLNGLDTLHMNGRLYWASGGRMVQPDPIITDPLNPQNWNPYSYVMNNPLNLIDPSGYSFLSKYWRTIVAVVVTVYTGGAAAGASWGWAAGLTGAKAAIAGGFVAGAIQTDSLRGGVYGAFSAGAFYGIGSGFQSLAKTGNYSASALRAGKIVAHGMAGGVMNSLQGGKFGHGFASAGFTELASPGIGKLNEPVAQGTAAALVGGTASTMTGGKFANGAVTAAFSYAFNQLAHNSAITRTHDEPRWPEDLRSDLKDAYAILDRPAGPSGVKAITLDEMQFIMGVDARMLDLRSVAAGGYQNIPPEEFVKVLLGKKAVGDSVFYGNDGFGGYGGAQFLISGAPGGLANVHVGGDINYYYQGMLHAARGNSFSTAHDTVVTYNLFKDTSRIPDRLRWAAYGYDFYRGRGQ